MSETDKKKWYVLRAISGKEAKVKEYLEQEAKTTNLGQYVSQILIPTEKVYQTRNGKKTMKEKTCLPGYVFVEANLVSEAANLLSNAPNVLGFLGGTQSNPTPLRPNEVSRMLGSVDDIHEGGDASMDIPYVVGEAIKVTDGPFSSFSGTVEEVNNEKSKLTVMVKIFGRRTPLELSFTQVEKE